MKFIQEIDIVWFYVIGYLFGVIIGDIMIKPVPGYLRGIISKALPGRFLPDYVQDSPRVVGLIERTLYMVFLQIEEPLLIGVWLTLKTASKWQGWSENEPHQIPGRATFNIFLAGNGLSILYSIAGYSFILWSKYYQEDENLMLIIAPICLLLSNLILNAYLKNKSGKKKGK